MGSLVGLEATGLGERVVTFLLFKQLSGQSSTLFLFPIVDKILQTMLVVTTAAVQHFRT